jgi:hypothetical protein
VTGGRAPPDAVLGTRLATAALKLALGIAVYVGIILIAGAYPLAAGMMLTFPTLNGLTLALAAPEKLAATARMMLPMPLLNCVLCAGYMFAFVRYGPAPPFSPATLLVAAAALWLPAVLILTSGWSGVSVRRERVYAVVSTIVLAAVTAAVFSSSKASSGLGADWSGFWQHHGFRIALFAVCLSLVIAATDFAGSSARWLAPLGSLPVVPFFGVLTVAGDASRTLDQRLDILRAMGSSVWLGAAVALWFVYLFSSYLLRRQGRGEAGWSANIALALAGWAVCLAVIAALTFALQRL